VQLLAWTVAVFAGVAALDAAWQRHSYLKKLRMSLRDIRQELKDSEGDPHIKQHRRQAHAEWSQRNAAAAARNANALVVNPTHVAIAIDYDRERCPVPMVSAKGEDHVARAMREAAEEAGVPIVRNVPLARDMLARAEPGELVPPDLFDVIAEVVLWAREVREHLAWEDAVANAAARGEEAPGHAPRRRMAAPGEDLTRYADADNPLRGARPLD
jgi:flagellar biosynthetic protein FlhB/type III secretion protein U